MTTVAQVARSLETILTTTANIAARRSGFIQRQRQLTGASFVQGLVFGWLAHPAATYDQLAHAVTRAGTPISPQGLEQRFSKEAATCLQQVLTAMVETVVTAQSTTASLLQRFTGVWLLDTTIIPLPKALAKEYPGSGRSEEEAGAALKLHTRLDLVRGTLRGPLLGSARPHDKLSPLQSELPPAGTVRLTDLGFYALHVLRSWSEAKSYWLCRAQVQTTVFTAEDRRWTLVELLRAQRGKQVVDLPVELGASERLPARLIAFRLDPQAAARRRRKVRYVARRKARPASPERLALCSWDVFVTNVPSEKLTADEVRILGRARWQIELLFKLWKSEGGVETSRSSKTYRILCELYAKLIGLVLQHWCLVLGCWSCLERSLTKAGRVVREYAPLLACALRRPARLREALGDLVAELQHSTPRTCRINRRKTKPNHYQLIQESAHAA
jgi:hypothetical protein